MKRRAYLLTAGTIATTGIAGCTGGEEIQDADTSTPPLVKILSADSYAESYGSFGVKGKARNQSGERLNSVKITSYYYDENDVRVAEGLDITPNVSAGTTFRYDSAAYADIDPSTISRWELTVGVSDYN